MAVRLEDLRVGDRVEGQVGNSPVFVGTVMSVTPGDIYPVQVMPDDKQIVSGLNGRGVPCYASELILLERRESGPNMAPTPNSVERVKELISSLLSDGA